MQLGSLTDVRGRGNDGQLAYHDAEDPFVLALGCEFRRCDDDHVVILDIEFAMLSLLDQPRPVSIPSRSLFGRFSFEVGNCRQRSYFGAIRNGMCTIPIVRVVIVVDKIPECGFCP